MRTNINERRGTLGFLAAVVILGIALAWWGVSLAVTQPVSLAAKLVKGSLPLDPNSPEWQKAPATQIPLSAQIVAKPRWWETSVRQVAVRAMTNGKEVALRLEWADKTRDGAAAKTEAFTDAAAVQFAVGKTEIPKPYFCMGQQEQTVNIWHWKAAWEDDLKQWASVDHAYPGMFVEYYYDEASDGKKTEVSAKGNVQGTFYTGAHADNILSKPGMRVSSVEDLSAGGFGTLTTQAKQDVKGKGVYDKGKWAVVFHRTLSTNDAQDIQLPEKGRVPVAFAVWDGANGERDGQKSVSTWYYLTIQ
ncbi:MAG: hypothetical protein HZA23_03305 [Nitrospirae bacterium]|nr:hypothetical protein [Nitrospirota bacterium]